MLRMERVSSPRMLLAMKIASRAEIAPFYVMEVMKAAAERERVNADVLHLEVGQPSTPAPSTVIAAAHRALDDHRLGYTDAAGIPQLRARIAHFYRQRYGIDVDPHQVVLTMGASGGFALAFLAAFDVGDRVAVTEPGYPCYRNVLEAFGVDVGRHPGRCIDPVRADDGATRCGRGSRRHRHRQSGQPDRHDAQRR